MDIEVRGPGPGNTVWYLPNGKMCSMIANWHLHGVTIGNERFKTIRDLMLAGF